jgi:hypothetical protein
VRWLRYRLAAHFRQALDENNERGEKHEKHPNDSELAYFQTLYSVRYSLENMAKSWFCHGQHTIDNSRPRV